MRIRTVAEACFPLSLRPSRALRQTAAMFLKSRALRLFFAALLVFAQQQAILHLLGHSFEQIEKKKDATDPQDRVCAKCLALAHLDHALSGDVPAIALPEARPVIATAIVAGRTELAFFHHYRSRAPPVFS